MSTDIWKKDDIFLYFSKQQNPAGPARLCYCYLHFTFLRSTNERTIYLLISIHAPRKGSDEFSLLLNIIVAYDYVTCVTTLFFRKKVMVSNLTLRFSIFPEHKPLHIMVNNKFSDSLKTSFTFHRFHPVRYEYIRFHSIRISIKV